MYGHVAPIKWDSISNRLYLHYLHQEPETLISNSEEKISIERRRLQALHIHKLALIVMTAQHNLGIQNAGPIISQIQNLLILLVFAAYHFHLEVCQNQATGIVLFINGLLKFQNGTNKTFPDAPLPS